MRKKIPIIVGLFILGVLFLSVFACLQKKAPLNALSGKDYVEGLRKLSAPANLEASDGTLGDKVSIEWKSVENATKYKVYRADSSDGEYLEIGESTNTQYLDDTTELLAKKFYKMRAQADGYQESELSEADEGYRSGVWTTLLAETFDRADGTVENGWTTVTDKINGSSTENEALQIKSQTLRTRAKETGNERWSRIFKELTTYATGNRYQITFKMKFDEEAPSPFRVHLLAIALFSKNASFVSGCRQWNGTVVEFCRHHCNPTPINQIYAFSGNTIKKSVAFTYADDVYYHVKIQLLDKTIKVKLYQDGASEPDSWNLEYDYPSIQTDGNLLTISAACYSDGAAAMSQLTVWVDDLEVKLLK